MVVSERTLVLACASLGVLQCAAPLLLALFAWRRRDLHDARPKFAHAAGEDPLEAILSGIASAPPGSEILAWTDGEPERPETVLPPITHAAFISDGRLRLKSVGSGARNYLRLAGFLEPIPLVSILVSLREEIAAAIDGARVPCARLIEDSHLLSGKNRWTTSLRVAGWWFLGAAVIGAFMQAYWLYWALRPWPYVHMTLLRTLGLAAGSQTVSIAIAGGWLLHSGHAPIAMAVQRWMEAELRFRARFFGSQMEDLIDPGSSMLDVGASEGLLAEHLASTRKARASAIDIAPATMGAVVVRAFDGRTIDLPDRAVDVCLSVFCLHHCRDPHRLLIEIRRVTARRFLLIEDYYDTPWGAAGIQVLHAVIFALLGMPWDPRGFGSLERWRRRLEAAGFRIVAERRIKIPVFRWSVGFNCRLLVAEPAEFA
ncbi:MAG: class I SAM-dependent methyltransferase [Elusimicrobia bacterium]|nr:class I SAM-dependent methyltransferase [Elusimicrobiota bacterium]